MVGIFEVAGVPGGERVEMVLDVFSYCVRFAPAVGDNGSTRRNHTGNSPSRGILVYFGENVKKSLSGVVRSVQVLSLSMCDEVQSLQVVQYLSELDLSMSLYVVVDVCVVLFIGQLSVAF